MSKSWTRAEFRVNQSKLAKQIREIAAINCRADAIRRIFAPNQSSDYLLISCRELRGFVANTQQDEKL